MARVYKMSFADGIWSLWRDEPDFAPLDLAKGYTGAFSDDALIIAGTWEIGHDGKSGGTTSISRTPGRDESFPLLPLVGN